MEMNAYKKTFFGSILAFFIGTSCCWMSSLAIGLGGVTFAGLAIRFLEDLQLLLIPLGIILLITTIVLYSKVKRKKNC